MIISGYVLGWEEQALVNEGGEFFYEKVQRGAFQKSIRDYNQVFLFSHIQGHIFAEARNGELVFLEDNVGLSFRIELSETEENRMLYELVKERVYRHISMGFRGCKSERIQSKGRDTRKLVSVNLVEISLTDNPAYKSSNIKIGCDNERLNMLARINKILTF